jgi:hypothetical protein
VFATKVATPSYQTRKLADVAREEASIRPNSFAASILTVRLAGQRENEIQGSNNCRSTTPIVATKTTTTTRLVVHYYYYHHHHHSSMTTNKKWKGNKGNSVVDDDDKDKGVADSVWVRLYERDGLTDAAITRTIKLKAMGKPFEITPVPRNVNALCDKVKEKWGERLPFAAPELVVYNFEYEGAGDEIEIPTTSTSSSGDLKRAASVAGFADPATSEDKPLIVVAPARTASSASATAGQTEDRKDALNRARRFVASIMSDTADIPGSNGMQVMKNVIELETGKEQDIVIRRITKPFWEECIRLLDVRELDYRVCAVGTPGTGKTTSTPFLIRMLLKRGDTVVYHVRTKQLTGWYYEFVPQPDDSVAINVYAEITPINDIVSLKKRSTFYIVDPAETKDSCSVGAYFQPKLLIVSSPDEGHWGESEFFKRRHNVVGVVRYFPLWDLQELLVARTYFRVAGKQLSEDDVLARFWQVGGVPRHIFESEPEFIAALVRQEQAMTYLTKEQAINIAQKRMDAVGSFAKSQPKSALIGYAGGPPFSIGEVEIISPLVYEKVFEKFMGDLWDLMLQDDSVGWKGFESYCRKLMAASRPRDFIRRPCCGKKENGEEYKKESMVQLGGCKRIRLVLDITQAAINDDPMTLVHSINPSQELIDFIYKDGDGTFHAFQSTVGKTHKAQENLIQNLRNRIGNSRLVLYYLIPGNRFYGFVTKPVKPLVDDLTSVWHILIPNPIQEQVSSPPASQL